MQVLRHFIVHVPKAVNDTMTLGDTEIFVDSRFNPFQHRVMAGEVVSVPSKYDTGVSVGDTLYFHHHVVMTPQLFDKEKDLYIVNYDPQGGHNTQAYLYKDKNGKLTAIQDWVFLDPIKEEGLKSSVIEVFTNEAPANRRGKVKFPSVALGEYGIEVGDVVYFVKNADYEMTIEGEKIWRMLHTSLEVVEK